MELRRGGEPSDWLVLAMVHERLGDRPAAIAAFRAALRSPPGYAPAQKELDQLLKAEQH